MHTQEKLIEYDKNRILRGDYMKIKEEQECYLVRHEYTDEFGFYEKENIAIYATEKLAQKIVDKLNLEKTPESDPDYDPVEDYFYEPYTIRTEMEE